MENFIFCAVSAVLVNFLLLNCYSVLKNSGSNVRAETEEINTYFYVNVPIKGKENGNCCLFYIIVFLLTSFC